MKTLMKITAVLCMLSACQFGWAMNNKMETFTYCSQGQTITAHALEMEKNRSIIDTYITLLENELSWGNSIDPMDYNVKDFILFRYPNGMDVYWMASKWPMNRAAIRIYIFKNLPPYEIVSYPVSSTPSLKDSYLMTSLPYEIAQYWKDSSSKTNEKKNIQAHESKTERASSSSSSSSASATTVSATKSAQATTVMAPASNSSTEEEMEPGAYVPTIQTTACNCIEGKSE